MPKAWNGGSIEAAMKAARERVDVLISQGATLCDECGGAGGTYTSGLCIQCHGAGCILPPDGLQFNADDDANIPLLADTTDPITSYE